MYIHESRDRTTIVHNLEILRMHSAISRLRKFSDCAEHIYQGKDEVIVKADIQSLFRYTWYYGVQDRLSLIPRHSKNRLGMRLGLVINVLYCADGRFACSP